ncbi:phosphatidylserine decarboxylase [Helicobacter jaachi]|uniref:Phosphatidylserine decarboxylase n=1 Tax=Helicobacter jaachi TaxID=1677920 RepID=A0A4U8TAR4_9HELI|nr:phosphatidylserine decarboxylase [Helicobacter jaachi]TLD96939.1 phosphatidylserine decarboxylase [Helicobacter jaachi]
MTTTTQIIAKQGWIGAGILLAAFLLSVCFEWSVCGFVSFIALIVWLVIFRNPERIPNNDEHNAFVAPVDGIIRNIESNSEQISILIETRLIDVGVIRAPCDIVEGSASEKKGLSLNFCSRDKRKVLNGTMSFKNLADKPFSMDFYPVFFASNHLFAHSNLSIGERMGFMKLGMTKIIIPTDKAHAEFELKVRIGDRIKALQSIIGYFYEV